MSRRVVRVPGHQEPAQLSLELLAARGQLRGLVGEGGILPAQLAGGLLVRGGLLPFGVRVHDRGQLGVAAAQRARLLLVGVDGRVGERVLKLRMLANQVR